MPALVLPLEPIGLPPSQTFQTGLVRLPMFGATKHEEAAG